MEEIKLWRVAAGGDTKTVSEVTTADQTASEQLLEDVLSGNPDLLQPGLTILGRQNETAGGPLDLLGVDDDGRLVVFELKRGTLARGAVAQVIDYASSLEELDSPALNELVNSRVANNATEKIDDFANWYQVQFGQGLAEIGKPRMMLVGLGADDATRRMVQFLAASGVDISLITFQGFSDDGVFYLAKKVEVAQRRQAESTKASKETNRKVLIARIRKAGIETFFNTIMDTISSSLHSYDWPNRSGMTFYLPDETNTGKPTNRAYLSLNTADESRKELFVNVYDRAIEVSAAEWPRIEGTWKAKIARHKGYVVMTVSDADAWSHLKPDIEKLCAAILRGRDLKQQEKLERDRTAAEKEIAEGEVV